jgi:hypothetical protein
MRGRVCRLQLLLVLASAVSLGSESRGVTTIFYCLRLENPATWRVRKTYLYHLPCRAECIQDKSSTQTTHRKHISRVRYPASPLARRLGRQKHMT